MLREGESVSRMEMVNDECGMMNFREFWFVIPHSAFILREFDKSVLPPKTIFMDSTLENLKFDDHGLIPAIIQDHKTHQVLMMAWMNRDAVSKTVETGKTHFFSRSRNKQWLKGESSGHVQHVKSISTDCDKDVLLIEVEQIGAACHDGYYSCFYRQFTPGKDWAIVGTKVFDPNDVYKK